MALGLTQGYQELVVERFLVREKDEANWEKVGGTMYFIKLAISHGTQPTSEVTGGLCHPVFFCEDGHAGVVQYYTSSRETWHKKPAGLLIFSSSFQTRCSGVGNQRQEPLNSAPWLLQR